jgi:hypothetical protein
LSIKICEKKFQQQNHRHTNMAISPKSKNQQFIPENIFGMLGPKGIVILTLTLSAVEGERGRIPAFCSLLDGLHLEQIRLSLFGILQPHPAQP